ncbi:serine hydrolase [Novosphingobium profundi]|uniref:serine hydrolase n=1 Tax=Novosphingobium profundi TaxID=1774954 RepID=UPI001BDAD178|nr:serine hydrolase [Novosphingobium profundi]MBT0667690.1 serine hydrolase [Novosphingobium profundi]
MTQLLRGFLGLALIACATPSSVLGKADRAKPQEAAARGAMARREDELVALLNGEGDLAAMFTPAFRKDVPEAQVRALAASLRAQLGRATGIRERENLGAHEARMVVTFEKGSARAWMALSSEAPHRIGGLRITGVMPAAVAALASLDEVAAAFAALPGKVGFAAQELSARPPEAALAPDTPLAIASAFKLVVLAELVRAIDAGERHWDDVVTLDGRELPAGGFRASAKGTRVTLRRLAEEMIRVSDNSASDLLLDTLGREKVEAMQAQIGFTHGARNVPFLSTMELFKLKGVNAGALGRRYLASDRPTRRAMLAGEVARLPGAAVGDLFADGHPVMIESLEWFASPADLVRALGWFHAHSRHDAGREALRILALNPGPAADVAGQVGYAGYKGGSEPGVLDMSVLLRDRAGRWWAVSATWNDPVHGIDLPRFQALFERALVLVSRP